MSNSQLPLTSQLIDENTDILRGLSILHVNHELRDIRILNRMLRRSGAVVDFVPIPYSEREGLLRGNGSWRKKFINERVVPALLHLGSQTVVVDDGGYAVDATLEEDQGLSARLVVEQTRFGQSRAMAARDTGSLRFPVISCARTSLKCRVESAFLAIRLADLLSDYMIRSGDMLTNRHVLLMGYGILGRPLARRLRYAYGCKVSIVDPILEVRHAALSEGFEAMESGQFDGRCDLIVGSSGSPAIDLFELRRLVGTRGVVRLASVSSGVVEFSDVIEEVAGFVASGRAGVRTRSWGTEFRGLGFDCYLLGDGRPLNFFRRKRPSLPVGVADLTNYRLIEALVRNLDANYVGPGDVLGWAVPGIPGPWMHDSSVLSTFCQQFGRSAASNPVSYLESVELHQVHPAESRLCSSPVLD